MEVVKDPAEERKKQRRGEERVAANGATLLLSAARAGGIHKFPVNPDSRHSSPTSNPNTARLQAAAHV